MWADYRQHDAGDRSYRVTIQYRRDADSETRFPVDDWDEQRSRVVWMAKQSVSGNERLVALQVQAAYDTKWRLTYRRDMDPDLYDVTKDRRLVFQGRVHNIVEADRIELTGGIELKTVANPSGETA